MFSGRYSGYYKFKCKCVYVCFFDSNGDKPRIILLIEHRFLLADNKLSFLVVSLIVVFLATNIEIFKIQ